MRVDLRRRGGRVAEQLLDLAQARAPLQQMCSVGVTERVRGPRADSRDARAPLERAADVRRREATAAHAHEQRGAPPATRGRPPAQPLVERLARGLADGAPCARDRPCRRRAGARRRRRRTPSSSPHTSLARRPQPYSSSSIARSRRRAGRRSSRRRAAGSQSPAVTGSGRRRRRLGPTSTSDGSSARSPRRTRSANSARADERRRAIVAGASRRAASRACQRRSGSLPQVSGVSPCCARKPHRSPRSRAQRTHRVRRVAVPDTRRDQALDGGFAGDVCVVSHQRERPSATMPAPL